MKRGWCMYPSVTEIQQQEELADILMVDNRLEEKVEQIVEFLLKGTVEVTRDDFTDVHKLTVNLGTSLRVLFFLYYPDKEVYGCFIPRSQSDSFYEATADYSPDSTIGANIQCLFEHFNSEDGLE